MPTLKYRVLCLFLGVVVVQGLGARGSVELTYGPTLWMMPPSSENGREFRELFESDPDSWKRTRARIDGLGYADHWLDSQFTDSELKSWLPQVGKWGLKLCLEVGAIKPWGPTGEKTFDIEHKMWDRFQSDGGKIDTLAMDEPLTACRNELHKPFEYAVEETARFMALVRGKYPDFKIGDIEPYPYFQADELMAFFDALQNKLESMHVRGMDFVRLDVDWMHFTAGDPIGQAGWNGVRTIELECRKRHIPFSLIYWAADYPSLRKSNLATDETWETSILGQGQAFKSTGATPDAFVIESWLDTPSTALPETSKGTFTKSVLDFCNRFLPGKSRRH